MSTFRFTLEPLLEQARQQETHERELFHNVLARLQSARDELAALEGAF